MPAVMLGVAVVWGDSFGKDGDAPEQSLFLQTTAGLWGKHSKAPKRGSGMWDVCPG